MHTNQPTFLLSVKKRHAQRNFLIHSWGNILENHPALHRDWRFKEGGLDERERQGREGKE